MPPAATDPSEVFVVSHTHWDREWYRTYHQFRTQLARVVQQVLEALESDPEFRHFLLDGQSIILDDYLEIHPEDRQRIKIQVERGALSVGPWYVLPDEFLVSAESTVRNLVIGHAVGAGVGHVQKIGYMPDSFGHIAQMPQILRRAGIDCFIYTRGNGDEIERLGHEFVWRAPDGSDVLAINQCGGYCNAGGLGLEEGWHAHTKRNIDTDRAVSQVRELFAKMAPLSQGDVYLLSNGCDHYPPQRQLSDILWALRRAFPETVFRHTSLREYVDRVRSAGFAKHTYSGELIRGRLHFILPGVWSARVYLKQQNDRAQTSLVNYLEPVSSYMHFAYGHAYPRGLIEHAWKLLLQNHPHDSICGCSVDEVHREMEPRFAGVIETAEETVRQHLVDLTPTFGRTASSDAATALCVMNPLTARRTEVIERVVVFQPPGIDPERLRIVDQEGRVVPHVVVRDDFVERFWGIDYRVELFGDRQREQFQLYRDQFGDRILRTADQCDTADHYVTVEFVAANLPALGHAVYRVRESTSAATPVPADAVSVGDGTLANEFYEVCVHADGTFDVFDKRTGHRYTGLNRLTDTADVGDEYDYAPCADSATVTSRATQGRVTTLENTGLSARLQAEFDWTLPAAIAADRQRRSEKLATCNVRVRVGLTYGNPLINVELAFNNLARDHRLRAEFPTGIETDTVISDGHFHVNHRPTEQPDASDWLQPPSGTYPQQGFSLLQDGVRGLAVLNRGLAEIEAIRDDGGGMSLALTLIRAVGWLSRDDFDTRRHMNAGPTLPTPDAQCLGEHRFHYAVVPFAGDYLAAGVKLLSERFRTPVLVVQGVEDGHVPEGPGLLEKASDLTSVSAVKLREAGDSLVVRLYNLTADPVVETLTLGLPIREAWRTDLLEERESALAAAGNELRLTLGPHEIVTVEIALGEYPISNVQYPISKD